MRQIAVVFILLLAMIAMKTLAIESQVGFDPLLLAAIGFVILASFSAGDLVNRLRLPRVTGYVLAGLLLGPHFLHILSPEVVLDITMFNTLALGLIALGAGLELEVGAIKSVGRTLLATLSAKLLILFPLIAGSVFFIDQQFGLTGAETVAMSLTVGLVVATLALGTSPAVALAVIEETGRHGRVSKLVLGSAVVKDIIMVLALAVSIAVGSVLITPEAVFSYSVVFDLLGEIVSSVLVGVAIGSLLILYMKYVNKIMLVVISLVIMATAEVSLALHLELLLVFIVAGFVVTNFSDFGHSLMKPIRTFSLPIFVIFFTNAGALIDLPQVQKLLPFALAIVGIRLIGLLVSHKIGSAVGKEDQEVSTWGWLGYIPQAGVTLGLLAIASERLPDAAPYFVSLALGMIAANLLVGPLALRLALIKGEASESGEVFDDSSGELEASEAVAGHYSSVRGDSLRKSLQEITQSFQESILNDGQQKQLLGQEAFLGFIDSLPKKDITPNLAQRPDLQKISDFLKVESEDFITTIIRLSPMMDSCRQVVQVDYASSDYSFQSSDSFGVLVRKFNLRVLSFVRRDSFKREVPLQTICKIHFNVLAARQGRYMLGLWYNSALASYDQIRQLLDGSVDRADSHKAIEEIWKRFHEAFEAESKASFGQLASKLADEVNRAGTAYADADSYRFSEFEPKIKKYLGETSDRRDLWDKKQQSIVDSVLVYSILDHLRILIGRTLEERCIIPMEELKAELRDDGQKLIKSLTSYSKSKKFNEKEILESCESLNGKMRDQYLVLSSMRMLNREISGNLNRMFDADRKYEVLNLESLGSNIEDPNNLRYVRVQFANNLNRTIFSILFPPVERLIDRVSEILDTFQDELDDVKKTLSYAIDGQANAQTGGLVLSDGEVKNLFSNVTYRIEENLETVEQALGQVREKVAADVDEAFKEAQDILQSQNVIRTATTSWYDFITRAEAWFQDRFSGVGGELKKFSKRIKIFAKSFEDTPAAEELSRRLKGGDLDAIVIKDYLSDRVSAPLKLERLPQIYRRLFTLDPLRDSRLFSAHRKVLDALPLGHNPEQAHRVLIVGKSGMGKSSLLNVAEMMAVDTRVVRLDRNYGTTHLSLISLLARQIGSSNSNRDILQNISKTPTTVIIDNMDHWWSPQSHDDVARLMEIIAKSGPSVNWIASLDSFNYKLFTQAFSIRSLFHRVEMLLPLNHKEMEEVILHRNELSGLEVEYSRSLGFKLFDRVWHAGPQEIYFELLRGASGGNIRSAVQHWVQSIDWIDNRQVKVHTPRIASPDLAFLESFNYESLLILKELYRFGPRSVKQLIAETHIRDNVLAREVESLRQSGLVVNKSRDGHIVQVDPMIKYYMGEQLALQQVI